jgi:formate dehydrogenase
MVRAGSRNIDIRATDTKTVHTFCRYCLASCGIEVTVESNQVTKISADKQNPHSWQDFCAKGRTANKLVEHPRRILNPMRRVGNSYVEATWDEAITDIAARTPSASTTAIRRASRRRTSCS